jgi:hypothetical protein
MLEQEYRKVGIFLKKRCKIPYLEQCLIDRGQSYKRSRTTQDGVKYRIITSRYISNNNKEMTRANFIATVQPVFWRRRNEKVIVVFPRLVLLAHKSCVFSFIVVVTRSSIKHKFLRLDIIVLCSAFHPPALIFADARNHAYIAYTGYAYTAVGAVSNRRRRRRWQERGTRKKSVK